MLRERIGAQQANWPWKSVRCTECFAPAKQCLCTNVVEVVEDGETVLSPVAIGLGSTRSSERPEKILSCWPVLQYYSATSGHTNISVQGGGGAVLRLEFNYSMILNLRNCPSCHHTGNISNNVYLKESFGLQQLFPLKWRPWFFLKCNFFISSPILCFDLSTSLVR